MGRKVLIGPSVYYPTPGTPLFERCKRDGILPHHLSQWRSSAFPIETKEFNRIDIFTLVRLARVINFIKGKMDEKVLEEGMNWKALHRILEEKDKAEVKIKEDHVTWPQLLLLLENKRSFFSLRKESMAEKLVVKEETSKKVLDYFLEKAWESPMLKSRNS
jgi:hypothetical protein